MVSTTQTDELIHESRITRASNCLRAHVLQIWQPKDAYTASCVPTARPIKFEKVESQELNPPTLESLLVVHCSTHTDTRCVSLRRL
eukprot:SAG31_NODE_17058_length_685_cov_0.696246_1_plen_85_part_10